MQPCSHIDLNELKEHLRFRDYWDSFIYATAKLICKYSISSHHWGCGVDIELQMNYVWLAWGVGKTSHSLWSTCVVLSGKNGRSHIIPVRLSPPGCCPRFHLMQPICESCHSSVSRCFGGWRLEKETIIAPCRRFVWAPKQENETDNLSFHSNNTNTSVSWYSTDSRLLLEVIWPPSLHINTHPYPTLSHCFVWLMINVGGSINSSKSMAPSIDFYLLYTD